MSSFNIDPPNQQISLKAYSENDHDKMEALLTFTCAIFLGTEVEMSAIMPLNFAIKITEKP